MSEEDLSELEGLASPGAGACAGQFTANTMACAFEALGVSPEARRWSLPKMRRRARLRSGSASW